MNETLIVISILIIILLLSYIGSLRNERESLRQELRQRGLGRYLFDPKTGKRAFFIVNDYEHEVLHKEGVLDQKKCGVCKNLGCDDGTLNEIEKNFYEKRRLELARNFYEEIGLIDIK